MLLCLLLLETTFLQCLLMKLLEVLVQLENGTALSEPQDENLVTYADKLSKDEAQLDWTRPAVELERQIRAFNPWPMAETRLAGETVKLLMSRVVQDDHSARAKARTPGTLLELNGDALQVACGSGVLELITLQRAGRKPVTAREFMNGLRPDAAVAFT